MLESTSGIIVAVSGGADSVALLDMLVRIGDQISESENTRSFFIHVAHLNHKLRGPESAEDAAFVESLAKKLNLQITVASADVLEEAHREKRGVEEVAREIRYKFLIATAVETGCDLIATGHTLSDQAETFLFRLARGAALRGLGSMRPVSTVPIFDAAQRLIRPLLAITHEEVEDYCRERGLTWRTDSTNLSDEYARNRVRHEVLPALKTINPRVAENIARAAEIIASDEDALDYAASAFFEKARVGSAIGTSRGQVSTEVLALSVSHLLGLPAGLRRRVILKAIEKARSQFQSYGQPQIASAHIASIEKLLEREASGSHIELPGRLEAWREFDALVIKLSSRETPEPPSNEQEFCDACNCIEMGGVAVFIERGVEGRFLEQVKKQAGSEKNRLGRDWTIVALDDRLLPERLSVRCRKSGEQALVLGQQKIKKLKNLMIDHKIPASRRTVWPVVTTPDGRYVWSPGLPPSVEFAAHDGSTSLAVLRASGF